MLNVNIAGKQNKIQLRRSKNDRNCRASKLRIILVHNFKILARV